MPPDCKWTTFLKAAHERETHTTQQLDKLFSYPSLYGNAEYVQIATDDYGGPGGLPAHVRGHLASGNYLTASELDHIDQWPKEQREAVRQALEAAVGAGETVKFCWELYHGEAEDTVIEGVEQGKVRGPIIITFRTPWSRVREAPPGDPQDVLVDVGT